MMPMTVYMNQNMLILFENNGNGFINKKSTKEIILNSREENKKFIKKNTEEK